MTRLAVMVVPSTVPSTRTRAPRLTAPDAVAVLTVTFWPAAVERVKDDVDTFSTVPDAPPAAGPDRALDPPPRGALCPDVTADVAVVVVRGPLPAVAPTMP